MLVLEPDPSVRTLFCLMLRRLGHEALTVDPYLDDAPDCDVVLVEPAWSPAVELVRKLRAGRRVPLVAASIYARPLLFAAAEDEADVAAHVASPARRTYLVKPFSMDELDGAIRAALADGSR